ncbi:MAG: hypothetical protein ABIQ95_00425 [Bdellovibrionia bacterium]
MTELNLRHLALSTEIIEKYRLGRVSYPKLVSRLEETLFSLESPPQDWFTQVSEKWEHLETINALILGSDDPRKEQAKFKSKIDNLLGALTDLVCNYPLKSGS